MKRLLARRQRLVAQAPAFEEILRGTIVERRLRCGKAGCHCAQGPGHPATYLCVTVGPGRTEHISLPPAVREQARRGVAAYERWWALVEQISAINRDVLRLTRARTGPREKRRRG